MSAWEELAMSECMQTFKYSNAIKKHPLPFITEFSLNWHNVVPFKLFELSIKFGPDHLKSVSKWTQQVLLLAILFTFSQGHIHWNDINYKHGFAWKTWLKCLPLMSYTKVFQTWELRMEKSAEKWGPGGRWSLSRSFLTEIRCKNCTKQPCIFQFCQFLTWCKSITF